MLFPLAAALLMAPAAFGGKENTPAPKTPPTASAKTSASTETAEQLRLYMWSWKIPADFIKNGGQGNELLKVDAEMHLDVIHCFKLHETKGAYADFKGGKLTVVHSKWVLQELEDRFDAHRSEGYKITPIGEMKEITDEMRAKLPKKKRKSSKKKIKTSSEATINLEAYYKKREKLEAQYQ